MDVVDRRTSVKALGFGISGIDNLLKVLPLQLDHQQQCYQKNGRYFDHLQQSLASDQCMIQEGMRFSKIYLYMQQREILELIQNAVRPLRQRLDHLEKENQQIKARISTVSSPLHSNQDRLRQRSKSKQLPGAIDKDKAREGRPPPLKKNEETNQKPSWNIGQANKPETVYVRSPSKNAPIPHLPRPAGKPSSKEKVGPDIDAPKKIAGGKKVESQSDSTNNGLTSPESESSKGSASQENTKAL